MHCFLAKAGELEHQWYIIDATDVVVGRLAAQIASILMGKHRPTYTPNVDTGDYVIVTNVDKVVFTGDKWRQKTYRRYTGWPSGDREEAAWKLFKRRPERILELAVKRMMPKNKIARHMLLKLKLYVGADHPHQAQAPIVLEPVRGKPAVAGALWMPIPEPKAPRAPREKKQKLESASPEAESAATNQPTAPTEAPAPVETPVAEVPATTAPEKASPGIEE